MVDSLLRATALRTENIIERVIYSHDISNQVKVEGEVVLKLWRDELEATSKYLDAQCSQKSHNIIVHNLKKKKQSKTNLTAVEAAIEECTLSKDLFWETAKKKIVQELLGAFEKTSPKQRGYHLYYELDKLTGRIDGRESKDKRLYFWTCGYSATIKEVEKALYHHGRSNQTTYQLIGRLNVTVLNCDLARFDKLNHDLSEDFHKTRERICQLYSQSNFLNVWNSFALNPASSTHLCGPTVPSNATRQISLVANNILPNFQMNLILGNIIPTNQSLQTQQLYNELKKFLMKETVLTYNIALIKSEIQPPVIYDVLDSITYYAKYLLRCPTFTYMINKRVLIVYDMTQEKSFDLIKNYEYIDRGNRTKLELQINRSNGLSREYLPTFVENWLINLLGMKYE